jgi:hypothetical protein
MNAHIRRPLGPERREDESARAYRAFCIYRDLGASRSLDRAWQSYSSSDQRRSARRPGCWGAWCQKYEWVERAEAHDDAIDEERRSAGAERRRQLQDERSRFQWEEQQRIQNRVRNADTQLDKWEAAPLTEVTQVKYDKITRTKTTTKIKPQSGRNMAAFLKTRNDTAIQAIRGAYDTKEVEREERFIERVVWKRNEDLKTAIDRPESHQGNREPIADLNADPVESEEDKAA